MKFSEFSLYLKRLEDTTKRLEITEILSELINKLSEDEIDKGLYLASGYLKAPFESQKFNIADKMMIKILENLVQNKQTKNIENTNINISELYREIGDLGNVAEKISYKKDTDLTLSQMYDLLTNISQEEGTGSQSNKIEKASTIIEKLDPNSAKFFTRIILGTLRLGFTELTIIAALAKSTGNKDNTKEIEDAFNKYPDIGRIAKIIKTEGLQGLSKVKIETGIPILSQRCQRVSGSIEAFKRIPNMRAEYKFDGTRVQLHMARDKVSLNKPSDQNNLFGYEENKILIRTYTRNLDESTHQFPELINAAISQIDATSVILDGEAIGYIKDTDKFLPFQETIQRKRKYSIEEISKKIPIKYYVFDILYLDGESLLDKPFSERRKILEKIIKTSNSKNNDVIHLTQDLQINSHKELVKYYEQAKEKGLEGLIVKNPDDPYQAGARSYSWIKLKVADEKLLKDSVDCVILGYYSGKGVRSNFGIGGFLVGIYDQKNDVFRTLTKIGTGLTNEEWKYLKEIADKIKVDKKAPNVEIDKILEPDVYVKPSIVVEVGADEISISPNHSTGYALRFPRLIKFRPDKSPLEATDISEITQMYKNQRE